MKIITSILDISCEDELIIASDLTQITPENAEEIISGAILERLDNGSNESENNNRNN